MKARRGSPNGLRICEELQKGVGLTAYDLECRVFIDVNNARKHLAVLKSEGLIHISGWRRDAEVGPFVPVYLWGCEEDAPKPSMLSCTERMRRYRKSADVRELEAARKRAKRVRDKAAKIKNHTLALALGKTKAGM